ncbi:response regulator [bacterium]|nr:response regulator [bacterium]
MNERCNINFDQHDQNMGQIVAGLAHEFNNIFTAISGSAEIALLETDQGQHIRSDLDAIRNASDRGAMLISQLLYAVGKKRLNREKMNDMGWERAFRKLVRDLPVNIKVQWQFSDNLWPIYVDREQLILILKQLLDNSINAMESGGTINISLDNIRSNTCLHRSAGPYLRILFEDSGCGMEKKIVQRVLEPFFTKEIMPGHSGLGLAMIHGIVAKHGGWIDIKSMPDEGAQFSIYLPAQPDWKAALQDESNNIEVLPRQRVLVVEDEEDVLEYTMMGLSQDGFEVAGAGSAEEAESLFGDEMFHMVISDVGLPDGNGVELIERLVTRRPALKVVLSSGYADHHHRWPAIRERGYPFLEKPYALQDLIATVRQMNA